MTAFVPFEEAVPVRVIAPDGSGFGGRALGVRGDVVRVGFPRPPGVRFARSGECLDAPHRGYRLHPEDLPKLRHRTPDDARSWAILDDAEPRRRTYRYQLGRDWGGPEDKPLVFVLFNPSVAGGEGDPGDGKGTGGDDPTIRKCKGFAVHAGYRRLVVVNPSPSSRRTRPSCSRRPTRSGRATTATSSRPSARQARSPSRGVNWRRDTHGSAPVCAPCSPCSRNSASRRSASARTATAHRRTRSWCLIRASSCRTRAWLPDSVAQRDARATQGRAARCTDPRPPLASRERRAFSFVIIANMVNMYLTKRRGTHPGESLREAWLLVSDLP